jgi:hypothetical protein
LSDNVGNGESEARPSNNVLKTACGQQVNQDTRILDNDGSHAR